MDIVDLFRKGGPAMWPLLALSILSLSVIIERLWFWFRILTQEREIVERVLDAARDNWGRATELARRFSHQPVGRFLYAPLRLSKPEPEVFQLALESSAEDELSSMRQGEKILEAVIALAPLLGLLGTVLGLIQSLSAIRLGDLGTSSAAGVTLGIGESLISTAAGLIVAIASLVFYRLFQGLVVNQVKVFRRAGSDLVLLYRQGWPNIPDIRTSPQAGVVQRGTDASLITTHTSSKSISADTPAPSEILQREPSGSNRLQPRPEGNRENPDAAEI